MNLSALRPADANRISNLITAFYASATIFAASELGIFGELSRLENSDAEGIAQALDLSSKGTTLLLDACIGLGLLEKKGTLYRNTPDTESYLVTGRHFDLTSLIREGRELYPCWARLAQFIRSGAAIECGTGEKEDDPARLAAHLPSVHARRLAMGRPVIRRLDLQGRKELLEVGGGPGTYSVLISLEFPQLHCTLLDRPEVVKIASALIEQEVASQHISTLAGDFRTMLFPSGNDVVLLFSVLRQVSADVIPELLRRVADSLNPGGIVYVMEVMTDETHTLPLSSAPFALNLALTNREGCVFSDLELQTWMEQAGLKDFVVETLSPPMPQWLAWARKP